MSPARRFVVIGHPVSHSLSPQIHARFASQAGIELEYTTLLAPLGEFDASARRFFTEGGRGANVTLPFKLDALRFADDITPRARLAGAANVLTAIGDRIAADNTDGAGLIGDLTRNLGLDLRAKRLLLLGAGGAARGVIAPLLALQPAMLVIANRTLERAQALAREFAALGPIHASALGAIEGAPFDLVLNATSTSTKGESLEVPRAALAPDATVYDMAYGPPAQAFLERARQPGIRACDGLGMLVEQAAEAFEAWHGQRPDTAPVLAALRAPAMKSFLRFTAWTIAALAGALIVYELSFLARVWWWKDHNPDSTAFMEAQLGRLRERKPDAQLKRQWVPYDKISPHLKRAIVAAEDARFIEHEGFDWEAIEKAMERNKQKGKVTRGGSTISQQLAKNLFLSGSRTLWRKGQEALITVMIENLWSKRRILEVYLNVIEWGDGVFGAEAAARHYYSTGAASLPPEAAARLAAMVPNPRFYDRNRNTAWLQRKTGMILARMPAAELP